MIVSRVGRGCTNGPGRFHLPAKNRKADGPGSDYPPRIRPQSITLVYKNGFVMTDGGEKGNHSLKDYEKKWSFNKQRRLWSGVHRLEDWPIER